MHMHRTALGLAVCLLSVSSALAEPAKLQSVDPLEHPRPVLEKRLRIAPDSQTPQQKIVPGLWARIAKSGDGEKIQVIIELREPLLDGAAASSPSSKEEDALPLLAALEHDFAAKAKEWVTDLRGLSHFPIVFGSVGRDDLARLAELPEVHRIYEDEAVHAHRTEGAGLMRANTLRSSFGGTGNGIGVAVLDSGTDGRHPELSSSIVAQGDYTGTTGDGTVDDNGHGTGVAGIVAGANGGVAPQAKIWAIKVLDAGARGTTSGILNALNSLYSVRNQFGGLDVINMSLGGGSPFNSDCDAVSPFNLPFNSLYAAGIAIFVASGNEGYLNGVTMPSCHSKVIAVGAVYDSNVGSRGPFVVSSGLCADPSTVADKITCYSNSGQPLDILAPADCARTPAPGGGYHGCFAGTSAAAPYAAGVGAQLLSLRPGTSPAALRSALMVSGRPLTGGNGITRNRIDAVAAFQALGGGGGGGGTGPCSRDADTACLLNGRFEAQVIWQGAASSGAGQVMSFGGQRAENDQSAFFWFLNDTNFEMGLKVIDGCGLNNRYWVFLSGLTDLGWTVTIRDTSTGTTKTYSNALGHLTTTTADTSALSCP